jgi:hypothetical protein
MANEAGSDRQRLLKLIDGDAAALKKIENKKRIAEASREAREFAFLFKRRAGEIFCRLRKGDISFSWLRSFPVNKVLAVVLAAMSVYLIVNFIGVTVFRKGSVVPATSKYEQQKSSSYTELSPLGYYLDQTAWKDIFNPQRLSLAATAAREVASSSEPFAGFRLVGIDWGEQPVALIEDIQGGKTYFVKKGDMVKDMRVIDILHDRVKVSYYNKLIELK